MDQPRPSLRLLDGAATTNLMSVGMLLTDCTEQYILDHEEQFSDLVRRFAAAGSEVIYTPTAGANRARLAKHGLDSRVSEINSRLASLTIASSQSCQVAGVLAPTDLYFDTDVEECFELMLDIFTEQAQSLNDAGVNMFVIECMYSIKEARAAVMACRRFKKPIFVTFELNERGITASGASPLACLIGLQDMGISAFGFNCSDGPERILAAISEIESAAKIPIIAKPSAGMPNPLLPNVYDLSPEKFAECIKPLLDAGAEIIGGCCGATPEHIAALRTLLNGYENVEEQQKNSLPDDTLFLSNELDAFALTPDRMEFTEPISCSYDMADAFISAEDDSLDVLLICIESADEAQDFVANAHLAKLPVCIHTDCAEALDTALWGYHGRAMIDKLCPIDEETLEKLACRYGAVIY